MLCRQPLEPPPRAIRAESAPAGRPAKRCRRPPGPGRSPSGPRPAWPAPTGERTRSTPPPWPDARAGSAGPRLGRPATQPTDGGADGADGIVSSWAAGRGDLEFVVHHQLAEVAAAGWSAQTSGTCWAAARESRSVAGSHRTFRWHSACAAT